MQAELKERVHSVGQKEKKNTVSEGGIVVGLEGCFDH